jgi:integrase/recombinase XerD
VPGLKNQNVRSGSWLGAQEAGVLLRLPDCSTLKGCRDRAMLGLMVGCGLARSELATLALADFQMRDTRWMLPGVRGRGGRIRAVPVPMWVKLSVDAWVLMAEITDGRVFRSVNKSGVLWGDGISEDTVWTLTREYGARLGRPELSPQDLRYTCARLCKTSGGSLEQIQLLLGHASVQTTARYLGIRPDLTPAVNDDLRIQLNNDLDEVSRKGPQREGADHVIAAVPNRSAFPFRQSVRGSR